MIASDLLNKVIINITPQTIQIRAAPLPWPPRFHLHGQDVVQFKVVERTHKFGRRIMSTSFSVSVLLRSGEERIVLFDVEAKDKAEQLADQANQAIRHLYPGA
jgi:hypothetical protein